MVKPVQKNTYMLLIGGGMALAVVFFLLFFVAIIGGAAAAQDRGNQEAAGAVIAGAFGMMMLAMLSMWVPAITFLVLLYKAWQAIQDGQVRTTPGQAVGFLFIPFFNLYWMFVSIWGWAADYNGYKARHNVPGEPASEGTFLAFLICYLIFPPACLVLVFMVVSKMCDGINTIAGQAPNALGAAAAR